MADSEGVDVFEITDFTNASPWERFFKKYYISIACICFGSFISSIEDILAQWGLSSSGELVSSSFCHYLSHSTCNRLWIIAINSTTRQRD